LRAANSLLANATAKHIFVFTKNVGMLNISTVAPAALLVDGAIRWPGLVGVGAHQTAGVQLFGALRDAHALGLLVVHLTDATGSAANPLAEILLHNGIEQIVLDFGKFGGNLVLPLHILDLQIEISYLHKYIFINIASTGGLRATHLVLLLKQTQEFLLVLINIGQVEVIQQLFVNFRGGLDLGQSQQP